MEQRGAYLESLATAGQGNLAPILELVSESLIQTQEIIFKRFEIKMKRKGEGGCFFQLEKRAKTYSG